MTATLLPNAKQQFIDGNGKPLAGASVYFYIPNTSTFKSTWQDRAQTILNTNPVILDASGEAIIWGSGIYRQVVYDIDGNLVWDQITEDANAGIIGNFTDDLFVAGTDFTPGVTTELTLSASAGSITNTWIFFDATYQADDQIASLDGVTLTFNEPIPFGVELVTVKTGTTVAIGTPGAGSVTDATVASNANINASKLSFVQNGVGAVRRTVLSKLQDYFDVQDFGAKGDGTTDDTTAINAALQAAYTYGKSLYLTKGIYMVTDSGGLGYALLNPGVSIFGEGRNNSVIAPLPSMPNTSAFMSITPPASGAVLDLMFLRDFLIFPGKSGTKYGGVGIAFNTSVTSGGGEIRLSNVYIQQGNDYSLTWTNDPTANAQGCPSNTTFEQCEFWEGTRFSNAGDNVRFVGCVLMSSNSSGRPGVNWTAVHGAGGVSAFLTLDTCAINCDGGALLTFGGFKPTITNCNIEQSHGSGTVSGSVIEISGTTSQIAGACIKNNAIGVFGATTANSAIKINNAVGSIIEDNRLTSGIPLLSAISITANALATRVGGGNQIGTSFITPIDDLGTATSNVRKALSLVNSFSGTPTCTMNKEGRVMLEGSVTNPGIASGGGITTLPTGFRPRSTLTIGSTGTVAGGLAAVSLQIDTSGNVTVLSTGTITSVNLSGVSFDITAWISSDV